MFCENGCAESTGDPHLTTFDGVRYSPQAVGELVLVESVDGAAGGRPDLMVQVRQRPLGPSRKVAVNAAVAVRVGADRVTLTLEHGGVIVRHDGAEVATERGALALPGGGTIERGPSSRRWAPDGAWVTWPDGSAVRADPIGAAGLQVRVRLSAGRRGAVRGLLGDFDGTPDDDLTTREGARITAPKDRAQLYSQLVESWRVSDAESLFDYAPGESTATFTDRTFPDAVLTAADLDPGARERAAAVCGLAGVVDSGLLENCLLDVAASGLAAFAIAAGESQRDLGARRSPGGGGNTGPLLTFADGTTTVPLDGDRATVDLTAPGAVGQVTFEAAAGQVVYVVLGDGTLPDGCGTVRLIGPSGASLRTGCLSHGTGALERTVLEKAGRYTVVADPRGDATGRLALRVVTAVDDEQAGTLDGPPVTVAVREPGAEGRVVFDAAAGQKVFVQVDPVAGAAPIPNQCGALVLRGPGGATLRSGCLDDGAGDLDALQLAESGRYTVRVNPAADGIGTARVHLFAVEDQNERLSIDGPAVTARIEQPGAVARLAFTGSAGQRVVVLLSKGTLPAGCGGVRVLDPRGREVASGCLRDGEGKVAITLRAAGQYVVRVDPRARATGVLDVRVQGLR
nr:VWD domain-containing protein [Myxococcus sp. RHSTA-1-4]